MRALLICCFLPIIGFSQSWNQVSNFVGDGRHHPITFSNDNFGYVVCGSYLNDMFKYDKSSDTWIQLQDFPSTGRGYAYGVTKDERAFVGFGSTSNGSYPTDWWEYNMTTDSWAQRSSFPGDGRNHPAMIVVNDKIYVGCGSNNTGNLGDWWEYDIILDTWSQKSDLIGNDRHHPFYFGIGDYAYVGFGHGSLPGPGSNPSSNSYIYNDFYRYNPLNDSWLQLNDFPSEARVAGTQFSYNGKGYVLSGDGDDHGPLDSGEFWEYNPLNDTWNQLTSHPGGAIWAPGNFVIGCDVYFMLGQNWNSSIPTDPISVYKYKLSDDCGCTDALALNFSSLATIDDGSCCYVSGCMDPFAINYDSLACLDDGSCVDPILGCMNQNSSNFDPSANTSIAFGGALDNTFGSGGFFNGDQHLNFNCFKECIINSAMIYSESNNTVTFELRSSSGNVLDDTTLNIVTGQQRVDLNFNVPISNNLQLGVSQGSLQNVGLFRNNADASYPYNIASAIDIISSSASTAPLDYYYFFYDLEVEIICDNISSVSFNCINQVNCIDPGDGSGFYSSLEDCQLECFNVSMNNQNLETFSIFSNPINDVLNVDFKDIDSEIIISVFDAIGNTVYTNKTINYQGVYSINISDFSNGVYFIEINENHSLHKQKFLVY